MMQNNDMPKMAGFLSVTRVIIIVDICEKPKTIRTAKKKK